MVDPIEPIDGVRKKPSVVDVLCAAIDAPKLIQPQSGQLLLVCALIDSCCKSVLHAFLQVSDVAIANTRAAREDHDRESHKADLLCKRYLQLLREQEAKHMHHQVVVVS